MAGKPKDPNDHTPEPRGGAREGAGRPRKTRQYSDAFKRDVEKNIKRIAKETGKSFGRLLCEMAWDNKTPPQFRSPFLKLIADIQTVKEMAIDTTVEAQSPTIYLPERMTPPTEEGEPSEE